MNVKLKFTILQRYVDKSREANIAKTFITKFKKCRVAKG